MPTELQNLVTRYTSDTRDVDRAYRHVERSTGQHLTKVEGLFRNAQGRLVSAQNAVAQQSGFTGLLSQLGNLSEVISALPVIGQAASGAFRAAFNPIASLVSRGFDFNSLMEKSRISFGVIMKDADGAKAHLEELAKFAEQTPFEFADVITGSRRLQAMGYTAQEVIPALRDIGDAAAAMGGDADVFSGIVTALGQMKTKGRLAAEEMNQLAERGIPAWRILSEETGKTIEQLRKLSERGKLSGSVAADLIQQGLRRNYGGMGEELGTTREVRESNLSDVMSRRSGEALGPAYERYKQAVLMATNTLGGDAAKSFTKSLAENSEFVLKGMEALIFGAAGGNITQTMTKLGHDAMESVGIGAGTALEAVKKAGGEAGGMLEQGFKDMLGMHSPSTVMIGLGFDAAFSFGAGFQDGFKKWSKEIEKAGGQEFIDAVKAMAERLGASFAGIMNVMAFESNLNPAIKNPKSSASGLIQFMKKTAEGMGVTTKELRGMSAIDQLKYVEKYFQGYQKRGMNLNSTWGAYAAVAGPGARTPDDVMYKRGSREYGANKIWDKDGDGVILARELAKLAEAKGGFTGVSDTNPMPVKIMGPAVAFGSVPTASMAMSTQRDITGGAGLTGNFSNILPATMGLSGLVDGLAESFRDKAMPGLVQWGDALNTVAMDDLPPMIEGLKALNSVIALTAKEQADAFARLGSTGGLKAQLDNLYGDLPSAKDSFKTLLVDLPNLAGNAWGSAFSTIEGGWKGMLDRMTQAFLQSLQEWAQQMLASQVTQFLAGVLGGALGGGLGGGLPNVGNTVLQNILPGAGVTGFGRAMAPAAAGGGARMVQNNYHFHVEPKGGTLPQPSQRQIARQMMDLARRNGG